jgi:pilus assembly protein CpaB
MKPARIAIIGLRSRPAWSRRIFDPQQVITVALAARTGSLTLALRSVADAGAAEVAMSDKESQYSVVRYGVATSVGFKN